MTELPKSVAINDLVQVQPGVCDPVIAFIGGSYQVVWPIVVDGRTCALACTSEAARAMAGKLNYLADALDSGEHKNWPEGELSV